MGGQNVHLNQSCRKFDEMPKSTKNFFHCLANGGWGVKMFTWTKVAGNLMKCLNPLQKNFFPSLFGQCEDGGVGQNVHLNQSCRKFDEMPESTKNFFHYLADGGGGVKMFTWTKVAGNLMKCLNPLKNFSHCLDWWGGGQNVHLNQSCRKFDEMPKSTKWWGVKMFHLFGWIH